MPGGVPLEWGLILAGRAFTIQLVFHHGYAIQLRTTSETAGTNFKKISLKILRFAKPVTAIKFCLLIASTSFFLLQQECWSYSHRDKDTGTVQKGRMAWNCTEYINGQSFGKTRQDKELLAYRNINFNKQRLGTLSYTAKIKMVIYNDYPK